MMSKKLDCKREKICQFINENMLIEPTSFVLEMIKKSMWKYPKEQDKKLEGKSLQNEDDFEEFINFQPISPSIIFFD